jgi:hypothetical protein
VPDGRHDQPVLLDRAVEARALGRPGVNRERARGTQGHARVRAYEARRRDVRTACGTSIATKRAAENR